VPAPTAVASKDVEQLVVDHLALVGHLAREAAVRLPRHLDRDDLAGAGALALVQAAHAFDPSLGVPFARFATTRVRGAMLDHMRSRDWATRSVRSRARALAGAAEELTKVLHRAPSDAELAAASGMSEAEVREVRHGADRASVLSLDPVTADAEGLAASLPDGAPAPDEALVAAERLGYLRDAIAELPDRVRHVVAGYYLEDRPLTELADELGVTQSRASQIRSEGLQMLQEALSSLLTEGAGGAGAHAYGHGGTGGVGGDGPTTAGTDDAGGPDGVTGAGGVRAKRRAAYVEAVARRSSVRDRADVQAYLDGAALAAARAYGAPLQGRSAG
jgi:RNA polymerase sigma factor for flagellar operon FliA